MDFKKEVGKLLKPTGLKEKEIINLIEIPKQNSLGDFAFPCFVLSKTSKKSPMEIAKELTKEIKLTSYFKKVQASGPYLNFFVNKEKFSGVIIKNILVEKKHLKNNKKIVIDFSHPNIAKPFGIGHLRSTVIGYSLYKIFQYLGYTPIGINHLGDWGTQFGKLIYAFKKWGKKSELKKEPIKYLLKLYIKFHKQEEKNPKFSEHARKEFKKLEDGDKQNTKLWKEFYNLSLKDFEKIYKRLNVKFDFYKGEAFYSKFTEKTINKFSKASKKSEGVLIVEINNKIPPCILKKSDEASTYASRDLAAIFDREKQYKPEKILYIVASPQILHFQQVFGTLAKINSKLAKKCIHIPFGLMNFKGEKLSTRKGKVIFMEEVLDKGKELAKKIIQKKNPKLKAKDQIADKVAIASIIYSDLSHDRILDIEFDWNRVLNFEGNTGPYLQYALVRARKIIGKQKISNIKILNLNNFEFSLIKKLSQFEEIINKAAELYKPSLIANYSYGLSKEFSSFYENCPVLQASGDEKNKRLAIVKAFYLILRKCLELLNLPIVKEM